MPGPKRKPKQKKAEKSYDDAYTTNGQRVSSDGNTVIMSNGHRFKRTVLPSVATIKRADQDENEALIEEFTENTEI